MMRSCFPCTLRTSITSAALCSLALVSCVTRAQAQVFFPGTAKIDYSVSDTAIVGYGDSSYQTPTSPNVSLVQGGSITGALIAYNSSRVTMTGGAISQYLIAYNGSTVNVTGGSIAGIISTTDTGRLNLRGGTVGGVTTYASSVANIRGGKVTGDFVLEDDSTLNLYGYRLTSTLLDPNYFGLSVYQISGTLADGTVLNQKNLYIVNGGQAHFTLNEVGYKIQDIGTDLYPYDINSQGQIVGYGAGYISGTYTLYGFQYSNGVVKNLNSLGIAGVYGINDSGQMVGVGNQGGSGCFLINGNTLTRLPLNQISQAYAGTHPNPDSATVSSYDFSALDINNRGEIVGTATFTDWTDANSPRNASTLFLYSGGALTDIGALARTTFNTRSANSYGGRINNSGQVLGSISSYPGQVNHIFLYDGGITDLTPSLKLSSSNVQATGLNNKGQVVGFRLNSSAYVSFLYSNGTAAPFKDGSVDSLSYFTLNDKGQVLGAGYDQPGVLYDHGKAYPLGNLLPATSGWSSLQGRAINNGGQIVGSGTVSGSHHGFLMTPLAPNTPPTTTMGVIGTPGSNNWYRSQVFVFLTATDTDPGDDVAKTTYELDGGPTQTYTGAILLKEGRHTITFRSTDLSGEDEETQAKAVNVDLTAPTVQTQAVITATVDNTTITNNQEITRPESALAAVNFTVKGSYYETLSGLDPGTLRYKITTISGAVLQEGNILLLTDNTSFSFQVTLDMRPPTDDSERALFIVVEGSDYAGNPTHQALVPTLYTHTSLPRFNVRTRAAVMGVRG